MRATVTSDIIQDVTSNLKSYNIMKVEHNTFRYLFIFKIEQLGLFVGVNKFNYTMPRNKHALILILAVDVLSHEHEVEVTKLRELITDMKCGNFSGLTEIRQELEAKHAKEMEELHQYFEQKCTDVEKQYSEDVFSQHSRKFSGSSSGSENEELSDMYYADGDHGQRLTTLTHICDSYTVEPSFKDLEEHYRTDFEMHLVKYRDQLETVKLELEQKYHNEMDLLREEYEMHLVKYRDQLETVKLELEQKYHNEMDLLREEYEIKVEELVKDLTKTHRAEIENIESKRQKEMQNLKEKLNLDSAKDLNSIRLEYAKEVETLKAEMAQAHSAELNGLKDMFEEELKRQIQALTNKLKKEEEEHVATIKSELLNKHVNDIKKLEDSFADHVVDEKGKMSTDTALQKLDSIRLDSGKSELAEHISHLEEQLQKHRLHVEQFQSNSTAVRQMKAQLRDLEAAVNKKTKDLESVHAAVSSASCSSPSEDVSIREQLDACRCDTPEECRNTLSPVCLPLDELHQLQDKLQHHSRAEEVALKRILDLEMQLKGVKKNEEEVVAERDVLQERMEEQLLKISALQSRLDEQRRKPDSVLKEANFELQTKVRDEEMDINKLRETVDSKDQEVNELKSSLEEARKIIAAQEKEWITKISEDTETIEKLKQTCQMLKMEKNSLLERVVNERMGNDIPIKLARKRSEGRMKSFASVTDRRAWSLDPEERRRYFLELIEGSPPWGRIISRGPDSQYVPFNVILDILMNGSNAFIAHLQEQLRHLNELIDYMSQFLDPDKRRELEEMRNNLQDHTSGARDELRHYRRDESGRIFSTDEDNVLYTSDRAVMSSDSEGDFHDSTLKSLLIEKDSEILALKNELASLTLSELSFLHDQTCKASSAMMMQDSTRQMGLDMPPCRTYEDKQQMSKRMSEIVRKQQEAQKKIDGLQADVRREKKHVYELHETLSREHERNVELQNNIEHQSRSIADLEVERQRLEKKSSYQDDRLRQFIVMLDEERTKARQLEDDLLKEKISIKHLQSLLESERQYARSAKLKDSDLIENMRITLEHALDNEAKAKLQLEQEKRAKETAESQLSVPQLTNTQQMYNCTRATCPTYQTPSSHKAKLDLEHEKLAKLQLDLQKGTAMGRRTRGCCGERKTTWYTEARNRKGDNSRLEREFVGLEGQRDSLNSQTAVKYQPLSVYTALVIRENFMSG
ncbi:myosin-11-like isoform X3 [Periplaneta americana]|uniref:myosin-11-like isoform X3 n=1 Tax=Periplaneta americana TaxID=6978 RepID=UPI0037E83FFB